MDKINVGIIGTGMIAGRTAKCLVQMKEARLYASGSRDKAKAEEFAAQFSGGENGPVKAYGSYEEMLGDRAVDLVYVASPHSHHYEHMKMCLNYGKAIICEKPFTVNAGEAAAILEEGRQKGILVAEAIWPRYTPIQKTLKEIIDGEEIGKPVYLTANLSFNSQNTERIRNPALAGGALLDLGVYCVNQAFMCFGHDVADITTSCSFYPTGVDALSSTNFRYRDGKIAHLQTAITCVSPRDSFIYGERGFIHCTGITNPEEIRIYKDAKKPARTVARPEQITGYEYEFQACKRALEGGLLETPEMPHGEIIRVMETMDALRAAWGFKYPME